MKTLRLETDLRDTIQAQAILQDRKLDQGSEQLASNCWEWECESTEACWSLWMDISDSLGDIGHTLSSKGRVEK